MEKDIQIYSTTFMFRGTPCNIEGNQMCHSTNERPLEIAATVPLILTYSHRIYRNERMRNDVCKNGGKEKRGPGMVYIYTILTSLVLKFKRFCINYSGPRST